MSSSRTKPSSIPFHLRTKENGFGFLNAYEYYHLAVISFPQIGMEMLRSHGDPLDLVNTSFLRELKEYPVYMEEEFLNALMVLGWSLHCHACGCVYLQQDGYSTNVKLSRIHSDEL